VYKQNKRQRHGNRVFILITIIHLQKFAAITDCGFVNRMCRINCEKLLVNLQY